MQTHSTRIPLVCPTCGQTFTRIPSRVSKFCSRKCRDTRPIRPIAERFWEKVRKPADPEGCWEWTAAKSFCGYGSFCVSGQKPKKWLRANRVAWTLMNGAIPENLCVCHRCDNPGCVNPTHLFLGTRKENSKDSMQKGRASPPPRLPQTGELNNAAKLTEEKVREMRRRCQPGVAGQGIAAMAREFRVSTETARDAIRGKNWSHVTIS